MTEKPKPEKPEVMWANMLEELGFFYPEPPFDMERAAKANTYAESIDPVFKAAQDKRRAASKKKLQSQKP
jgi:hypothetical protein